MKNELVIVLDFGGQYNQLVARRVRECNVYCEIYSYKIDIEKIKAMNPKGIILTGGPNSCYEPDSPTYSEELFKLGIPVLGLCYGAQLMSHVLGGKVEKADVREYGKTEVIIDKKDSKVFENVSATTTCWMSHFDYISQVAPGFEITAHTADCPVAAAENAAEKLYAIQFHPEVLHTPEGTKMINNFVKNVCGCVGEWKMDAFVENTIQEIREKVGDGRVLLALSGGVDSSVAAGLLSRAIGKQLTCVFVATSRSCRTTAGTPSRRPAKPRRWSSSMCALPTGRKRYCTTSPSPCPGTRCWPWWGPPAGANPPSPICSPVSGT